MILLAVAAVTQTRFDPLELFLNADIVVQAVIAGLILASVWVWMIIVSFALKMGAVRRRSDAFEAAFWEADAPGSVISRQPENPSARVASAGLDELSQSTREGIKDRDAVRNRVAVAMEGQAAQEADTLAERLNFLATTGSVAPFVGLFGTVWGIMNSFFQIGEAQNSSLAVVAPGISEALFATAVGLFAAIPAVIAYNRFSHRVNAYEARLRRFSDKVHAQISRELERG
jgi:biopolymer transport protein TolQ